MNRRQFLNGSSAAVLAAGLAARPMTVWQHVISGDTTSLYPVLKRNWLVLYESNPTSDGWFAHTFFDATNGWPDSFQLGWSHTKRFIGITKGELVERLENENKAVKVVFPSRRIGKTAAIGDSWKSLSESDRVAPALANRQTQPGEV